MKAGFARLPITPDKPMTLAGFDRRTAPAAGALEAMIWAKDRAPGIYTMRDVLGFSK